MDLTNAPSYPCEQSLAHSSSLAGTFSRAGRPALSVLLPALLLLFSAFLPAPSARAQDPVHQEYWTDLPGDRVPALSQSEAFFLAPDHSRTTGLPAFRWAGHDHFGSRLRTVLTAPVSGTYHFSLIARDQAELFLSPDGSLDARQKIARVDAIAPVNDHDRLGGQRSPGIELAAGQPVLLEVLHKLGTGTDRVDLAWSWSESFEDWTAEPGVTATQSTSRPDRGPEKAIDGDTRSGGGYRSVTETLDEPGSWWEVDLGAERPVDEFLLWNRLERGNRLSNFRVTLRDESGTETYGENFFETSGRAWARVHVPLPAPVTARHLRVELLGENRGGDHVLSLAEVQVFGRSTPSAARQELERIPDAVLSQWGGDPLDADVDELPDAWETTHGFDPAQAQEGDFNGAADPDGDHVPNFIEARADTDPFAPDILPGQFVLELWDDMPWFSLAETLRDPRFYGPPTETRLVEGGSTGLLPAKWQTGRLRGWIEAPATGDYTFWLSASASARLSVSEAEDDKYHKRMIAELAPELGTSGGVFHHSFNRWDSFGAQMSEPVHLEAGKRYYLEVLQQNGSKPWGHVSLAWAPPGQGREPLSASAVSSYLRTPDDEDDDSLPDAWETAHGLDPEDNGAGDIDREGERGDFDADGLTNLEEYQLGTDPASGDSDGDGLGDYEEVTFYGTDPATSNQIAETEVGTIDLENTTTGSGNWSWFDGGLLSDNIRGSVGWNFTVPGDGWWLLEITGRLRGSKLFAEERLDLVPGIDGKAAGRRSLRFRYGEPSSLRIATPWLSSGTHQLELLVDNYIARRTFQIQSVRVLRPEGLDSDGDGTSDWMEDRVRGGNGIEPHATSSVTSPFFLEGRVRYQGDVAVQGPGGSVPALAGLSGQHWFADLPLSSSGPTAFSVAFEGGQLVDSGSITWSAWNAYEDPAVELRAGDILKLTATEGGVPAEATVDVDGSLYQLAAGDTAEHPFSAAGEFPVTTTLSAGGVRATTVTARAADFGEVKAVFADRHAYRNFSGVREGLWIEPSPHIRILERTAYGNGVQRLRLVARQPGQLPLAARLGDQSGPIVALGEVPSMGYSDAMRNDATLVIGYDSDGYQILQVPIVVTHLPPGGYVVVTIHRAGITFLDGTTTRTLHESDFNDGVAYLEMRLPPGMSGAYCHYVEFYDAEDNYLGRH